MIPAMPKFYKYEFGDLVERDKPVGNNNGLVEEDDYLGLRQYAEQLQKQLATSEFNAKHQREMKNRARNERDKSVVKIKQLQAEKDALVAQVEMLRDAGNEVYAELQQWALCETHEETELAYKIWIEARRKTPQQCLAEIKGEAGRAGFIAGAQSMKLVFQYGGTYNTEDKADQYAATVRQGGAE